MIEKSAFVKVGIFNIRAKSKELASHLEHVIDVAGFGGAAVDAIAEFVRFAEIFVFAVAAGGVGMMLNYAIPEKARGETVSSITGVNETSKRAHDFGDLRVSVET